MILIRDVKCKLNNNDINRDIINKCSRIIKVKPEIIKDYIIVKCSIDARKKPDLFYNYHIALNVDNEDKILSRHKNPKVSKYVKVVYKEPTIKCDTKSKCMVIGAGPAGLFCGLILAKAGLKPIIVERGSTVDKRLSDVQDFWRNKTLKIDSNVQFGEGGAGTFSDGKLNTGVKDKDGRKDYVLNTFVRNGADDKILYDAKPHMGTDTLTNVVCNLRKEIIKYGGSFYFDTKLEQINSKDNKLKSVSLSGANEGEYRPGPEHRRRPGECQGDHRRKARLHRKTRRHISHRRLPDRREIKIKSKHMAPFTKGS